MDSLITQVLSHSSLLPFRIIYHKDPHVDTKAVDSPYVDTKAVDSPYVDTKDVDSPYVDTKDVDSPYVDTKAVDSYFTYYPHQEVSTQMSIELANLPVHEIMPILLPLLRISFHP
jgi:hypothetical protein